MRFASLQSSNTSDYANAGKKVAKSAENVFETQRKSGPDYGKLSMTAMKTQTEEKIAAMNAEKNVVNAGIKAHANVTKEAIRQGAYREGRKIDSKLRKAGTIAAIGSIAGGAYLASTDPEKGRKYPNSKDARNKAMEDHQQTIDGISTRREASDKEASTNLTSLLSGGDDDTPTSPSPSPTVGGPTPGKVDTGGGTTPVKPTGNAKYDGTFSSVYDMARNSGATYPQLVAAQWQLESGSGSALSGSNNFFGIKAGPNEEGTTKGTWEESNGQAYNTSARFKNFSSPQASVDHLVSRWHQDYQGYSGVNNSSSAQDAARSLKAQGYATDSKYADKLINIMRRNGY